MLGVSPLVVTSRHSINHPSPGIAVVLQHLTKKPEGDSGNLDQPVIRGLVVIVHLPKPEAIYIWEVLHVLIGGADPGFMARNVVARVEIDKGSGAIAVQHLPDSLHNLPVVPDSVEVQSVNLHVSQKPSQAFKIVVVPARKT